MSEENIIQEFRLKNIDETKNYLIEEINRHVLMIEKYKRFVQHLIKLTLCYFSFYNYCICFHFCFCFFSWYSCRDFKLCSWICAITAGIKKYNSITKKKKKKHDEIILLAKSKLNSIIDSIISQNEFVLISNVLKEYDETKEKIKNSNNK